MKNLVWNVYIDDINAKCITKYNIFDHGGFMEDVRKAHKEAADFDSFADKVKHALQYFFWSKCEWEIILSDWPPSPESRGFKKEKIDVYDQVMLNWDIFVLYIWNNIGEEV